MIDQIVPSKTPSMCGRHPGIGGAFLDLIGSVVKQTL